MRTIHKYEVPIDSFALELPKTWGFLHVDIVGDKSFMWIEVDTDQELESVDFTVVGTGWDMDEVVSEVIGYPYHLGTFIQGPWVWHLYLIDKT